MGFKDNNDATNIFLPDVPTDAIDKWLDKVYNRKDIGGCLDLNKMLGINVKKEDRNDVVDVGENLEEDLMQQNQLTNPKKSSESSNPSVTDTKKRKTRMNFSPVHKEFTPMNVYNPRLEMEVVGNKCNHCSKVLMTRSPQYLKFHLKRYHMDVSKKMKREKRTLIKSSYTMKKEEHSSPSKCSDEKDVKTDIKMDGEFGNQVLIDTSIHTVDTSDSTTEDMIHNNDSILDELVVEKEQNIPEEYSEDKIDEEFILNLYKQEENENEHLIEQLIDKKETLAPNN